MSKADYEKFLNLYQSAKGEIVGFKATIRLREMRIIEMERTIANGPQRAEPPDPQTSNPLKWLRGIGGAGIILGFVCPVTMIFWESVGFIHMRSILLAIDL